MITMINLQFINLVLFYRSLFKIANSDIKLYLKSRKAFTIRQEAVGITKKDTGLIDEVGDITKLIIYYDQVANLCRHANLCFNESLMLTSILSFITILMSLYFVINKWITFGIFVFQFSYSVLNLWLILYVCESTNSEVSKPC